MKRLYVILIFSILAQKSFAITDAEQAKADKSVHYAEAIEFLKALGGPDFDGAIQTLEDLKLELKNLIYGTKDRDFKDINVIKGNIEDVSTGSSLDTVESLIATLDRLLPGTSPKGIPKSSLECSFVMSAQLGSSSNLPMVDPRSKKFRVPTANIDTDGVATCNAIIRKAAVRRCKDIKSLFNVVTYINAEGTLYLDKSRATFKPVPKQVFECAFLLK